MNILNTPEEFLDFSVINYPNFNEKPGFEAYFYNYFLKNEIKSDYTYIPVQWTNYFIKQNYGKDIEKLKIFIENNIASSNKYFTVVQYDGGPLLQLENCLIFNMGGMFSTKLPKSSKSISLPLIYEYNFSKKYSEKKFLASYLGRPTHEIRKIVEKKLKNNNNFYIENLNSMNSNIDLINLEKYENLIKSSSFFLCPRGYGPTSFRLYESIELGTIPVYISDEFILPFEEEINWKEFSVIITKNKIGKLPKILDNIINSQNYDDMQKKLEMVRDNYFNFKSTAEYICKKIKNT